MTTSSLTQLPSGPESSTFEFIKSQYNQAFEVLRLQINLFIKVSTILVVADVSLIGYAMNQHSAGIVAIGMIFPLVILATISLLGKTLIPVMFTILRIERAFSVGDHNWLGTTYFAFVISEDFKKDLERILEIQNSSSQFYELRKIDPSSIASLVGITSLFHWLIILAAIGQLVSAGILFYFFHWPLI